MGAPFATIKSNNYLRNALSLLDAEQRGYDMVGGGSMRWAHVGRTGQGWWGARVVLVPPFLHGMLQVFWSHTLR